MAVEEALGLSLGVALLLGRVVPVPVLGIADGLGLVEGADVDGTVARAVVELLVTLPDGAALLAVDGLPSVTVGSSSFTTEFVQSPQG